jgi:PadR family transcriptional regulator, regulatory protein AphA
MRHSLLALEIALLGFLQQGPKHGYAIHQELSGSTGLGAVWQIKLSQLYALLGKLETAGYVTATTAPQQNKPPRKIFHLTEAGQEAFLAWLQTPVQHGRSLRLEFLVKLYFARLEGTAVAEKLLADQRALCHEWLATEQEIVAVEIANGRRYGRLVHQFRSGQLQAMLNWLDLCAET